jgi:hypothetical protein
MQEKESISEGAEIAEEVVGFDLKKFWYTFRDLTLKPGQMIAAYCDGDRMAYVRPITYFLVAWGAVFFLTSASDFLNKSISKGNQVPGIETNEDLNNPAEGFINMMKASDPNMSAEKIERLTSSINGSYEFLFTSQYGMLLILIPVFLPLQWLFFRRYRKSFIHHLYFYLYASAQLNILTLPALMLVYLAPSLSTLILTLISILVLLFYYYAEFKFFTGISIKQLIVRNVAAIAISIIPLVVWLCMVWFITFFIFLKLNL